MSEFGIYFTLGFQHISDLKGYDHILFLIALCAPCVIKYWKSILALITAFTVGHSISLALSTLGYILVPVDIIEFLIPVTIFLTCLMNIVNKNEDSKGYKGQYVITLFFGTIHGMGFSNYLRMLLGREESLVTPLFAFNIGLEVGQIMIVSILLGVTFLFVEKFKVERKQWILALSFVAATYSIYLMYQTKFW